MEEREAVLAKLEGHREDLSRLGVKSLALFGSTARGEGRPDSDVDLFVEFDHPVGLFAFLELKGYLEHILARPVDLVTPNALRPTSVRPCCARRSMPARDWKARLQDIALAIAKIDRYTRGMTSDAFRADEKTVDAVVRNLVVVGEASRHIPEGVEGRHGVASSLLTFSSWPGSTPPAPNGDPF